MPWHPRSAATLQRLVGDLDAVTPSATLWLCGVALEWLAATDVAGGVSGDVGMRLLLALTWSGSARLAASCTGQLLDLAAVGARRAISWLSWLSQEAVAKTRHVGSC